MISVFTAGEVVDHTESDSKNIYTVDIVGISMYIIRILSLHTFHIKGWTENHIPYPPTIEIINLKSSNLVILFVLPHHL